MKTIILLSLVACLTVLSSCAASPPPPVYPSTDVAALTAKVTGLSNQVGTLQAQVTKNNSQIAELAKTNDSLNAQITALKKTPPTTTATAAPVSATTADILTRLAAVEAKTTATDLNQKQLDASTKAGLKAADDNLNARIASLSNQTGLLYASKSDVAGWQNYMIQLDLRLQAVERKVGLR